MSRVKNGSKTSTNLFAMLGEKLSQSLSSLILVVIDIYRIYFSGIFGGNCRFYPTCSEYAVQVFNTQPFPKAFLLLMKRLSRCHPLNKSQVYDPAPHQCCHQEEAG